MDIPTLAFLMIAIFLAIVVGRVGTLLKDLVHANKDHGKLPQP